MFQKKAMKQLNKCASVIGLSLTKEISFSTDKSFLIPFTKALLCFFLAIGSVCGFASCFGAQFNMTLVLAILLSVSLLLAYTKNLRHALFKNILYIVFFFLYAFFIRRYFNYVNSGYHSIVNLAYASLENYLDIPALVYYEEIIENSYTTITLFLIFWGIFNLFLFHMLTTEHIHFLSLFICSMSPLVIPLFIEQKPDTLYLFLLIWGYFIAIILRFCNHHTIHRFAKQTATISYERNGLTYFCSLLYSFILCILVFALVTVVIPYPSYKRTNHTSTMKENVLDEVRAFVSYGFSAFFNQYSAIGGMNDGNLGGIHSVRPDYQTDLIVRMVPNNYETQYLRGFVGIGYTSHKWYSMNELINNHMLDDEYYDEFFNDISLYNEQEELKNSILEPHTMKIANVGADTSHSYCTYYCDRLTHSYDSETKYDTHHYYSIDYLEALNKTGQLHVIESSPQVLSACLQIPDRTRNAVIDFLIAQNLCTSYIVNPGTNSNLTGETLDSVLAKVSECMSSQFTYSMNPGLTPKKDDFVGYFLNRSQKGFCVHFASSAAMILRTLGIPTRYVEGYVITYEDLMEGVIVENEKITDYNPSLVLPSDAHVLDVSIADDKAHAWLEYYDPAFGWKVFEATTASTQEYGSQDFWRSFYGFLNQNEPSKSELKLGKSPIGKSVVQIFRYIMLGALVFFFVIVWLFLSYKYTKQYRSYHRNRYNINVRNLYKLIAKRVEHHYPDFAYIVKTKDQLDFIASHYRLSKKISPNNLQKLCTLLEQAEFSRDELTGTEAAFSMKLLHLIRRNLLLNFRK